MLELKLNQPEGCPLHVLCLGAHADDIEIGAGGTLLKLVEAYSQVVVTWVVFAAKGERAEEAKMGAGRFLRAAKKSTVIVNSFRDGFFPFCWGELKEYFEHLKGTVHADVIFTHFAEDAHQDHRTICQLTWNTFRDHCILEYEIPKYDGDLGRPNLYVALDEETSKKKVQYVIESFPSQRGRHWFTEDVFLGILRIRGVESGSGQACAEAFHCRKVLLL